MQKLERDTLGAIWRLCDQMAYSAEKGMTNTLKAQAEILNRLIARLDLVGRRA